MTRKDYILIAAAIKAAATEYPDERPDAEQQQEDVAFSIAEALYWYCFPGCMPDSDIFGPFATRAEAIEDMREKNAE